METEVFYGRLAAEGTVVRLDGCPFSEWADGRVYGPDDVRVLASGAVENRIRGFFGYTAANDITARNLQAKDGQ